MSFTVADDGSIRNANPADPHQQTLDELSRCKDGNGILKRQLSREQEKRKLLEQSIRAYLLSGDRHFLSGALDGDDASATKQTASRQTPLFEHEREREHWQPVRAVSG